MRPSQAKHRAKGEFTLCGLVLSSCRSKACRSPMADSIPEWHEIDFWSSHPINGPALWAIGALMAGVVGVSVWGATTGAREWFGELGSEADASCGPECGSNGAPRRVGGATQGSGRSGS